MSDAVLRWAASGAMALTGYADAAPAMCVGDPVAALAAWPGLPITTLAERAWFQNLRRSAPFSCGGGFQILPAADAWVGISLARECDQASLPALVGRDVDGDPWAAVAQWLRETPATDADQRLALLGMPGGQVGAATRIAPARDAVKVSHRATPRPETGPQRPRRVVDFSALWAGPLCARLLAEAGAEVVRVESVHRPDLSAYSVPLRTGVRTVRLDPMTDRHLIAELVADADAVIEASRPRALRGWGLEAEEIVARGTTWVSITAYGRDVDRIGFGDDVAACAGLVAWIDGRPVPAADAIADPLSGVAAAAAVRQAWQAGEARMIDVSMAAVARDAATGPAIEHKVRAVGAGWQVETANGVADVFDGGAR